MGAGGGVLRQWRAWLAASDFLVQAAVQLLMHGNLSYIREKLQSGLVASEARSMKVLDTANAQSYLTYTPFTEAHC